MSSPTEKPIMTHPCAPRVLIQRELRRQMERGNPAYHHRAHAIFWDAVSDKGKTEGPYSRTRDAPVDEVQKGRRASAPCGGERRTEPTNVRQHATDDKRSVRGSLHEEDDGCKASKVSSESEGESPKSARSSTHNRP